MLLISSIAFSFEQQWETIFNGNDLTDWTVKIKGHKAGVNYKDTFQVEKGSLVVSYDHYEKFNATFGHIF